MASLMSNRTEQNPERETDEAFEQEMAEIRKHQVFLSRSYEHVNCVGLDNGWYKREIIGPAEGLVEYSEAEQEKFGVKYKYITISGYKYQHNERYWKRMGEHKDSNHIYTTRHTQYPDHDYSWHLNSSLKQMHKRYVKNCYGETWEETLPPSWYAVKNA